MDTFLKFVASGVAIVIGCIFLLCLLWLLSSFGGTSHVKNVRSEYEYAYRYIRNTCVAIVEGSFSPDLVMSPTTKMLYINTLYTTFMSVTSQQTKAIISTTFNNNEEEYIKYTLISVIDYVAANKRPKITYYVGNPDIANRSDINIDIDIDDDGSGDYDKDQN